MSFTDYTALVSTIGNWLNRSDLSSYIPDFITLAHSAIRAEVRHWRMYNRARATLDSQYTELPADFVELVHAFLVFSGAKPHPLIKLSPNEMLEIKANYGSLTGRPKWISIEEEIQVWPAPDQSYTLEMLYYEDLTALSGSSDTNWLLTRFPGLYLYGALREAAPFLKEDERVMVWDTMFEKQLRQLKKDNQSASLAGSKGSLPKVVF